MSLLANQNPDLNGEASINTKTRLKIVVTSDSEEMSHVEPPSSVRAPRILRLPIIITLRKKYYSGEKSLTSMSRFLSITQSWTDTRAQSNVRDESISSSRPYKRVFLSVSEV